ncbi:MAG: glycosyltransferase [Paludibacteraceae bacterium]|nr:glycosyltransferase [Paludibacteraceae bacterium]
MNLAPVVIFNYNRPDHSLQTWEALSRNQYASETELYLYCDGPKANASVEMRQRIGELHQQAKQYAIEAPKAGKFKSVHVVCAETNKGLANSIIGGVSEVIAQHGRVIVLEDDLLTSPYFLKYMNEALDKYDSYPAVFSISANRPPLSRMQIPSDYEYDVFVSLRSFSTGWATWQNKWECIDWSLDYLDDFLNHPEQIEAFNRGGDDMTDMLLLQRDHKIDSWAIRYSFQHFYHHAVAILPCVPYVDNIGFDGTGIHSGSDETDFRNNVNLAPANPRMLDVIYEDAHIINAFANCYSRAKRPIWQKAINCIYRKLGKNPPFQIKQKIYC